MTAAPTLLPPFVARRLDAAAAAMLTPDGAPMPDLSRPAGEPGLFAPDSVAWAVFANPVSLLVGGVAAVLLELAHPAVRAGVWTHSRFPADPVGRIRRTGHAAMLTVYAPRSIAEPAIARIVRRHGAVRGTTPEGLPYHATDPALLAWVHATATYGFTAAHDRYAAPLGAAGLDRAFAEAMPAARLHGAHDAPAGLSEWRALLERTLPELDASPVLGEFLTIMRAAPLLPRPLRALQPLALRGAVAVLPGPVRDRLALGGRGLRPGEGAALRALGGLAGRVGLPSHPANGAALRLGGGPDPARNHAPGAADMP